jgi:hypothetical protein
MHIVVEPLPPPQLLLLLHFEVLVEAGLVITHVAMVVALVWARFS